MSPTSIPPRASTSDDVALLESLGYKQELGRRMGAFSNFAISFSIICILAGGITAFPSAIGAGGGLSVGIGWPLGAGFALIVASAMAQIASSYPTAGGLYHWSSILGGKGWGWATAWFNLLGLIFVTASVNFGVWDPFFKSLLAPLLGIDASNAGWLGQTMFIAGITIAQGFLNARAPKITTWLTDFSGYMILVLAVLLTGSLLAFHQGPLQFSRLLEFTNMTGLEGSWWPSSGGVMAFLSGLLLVIYTITGYDASAHASEETHEAAKNVPKGIVRSVIWSALFGFAMIAVFVATMPDIASSVKLGFGFFGALLGTLPAGLKAILSVGIFLANFLCGLAALTATSRMMYAFARDGGLPFSKSLKTVEPRTKTPVAATWTSTFLVIAATMYGDAFLVLSTGCVVLLYLSYVMPTAAGLFAEGKTWTVKGPFDLGAFSKPIAVLAVLGGLVLAFVGVQPPNQKVAWLVAVMIALLAAAWWLFGVRKSFQGPPARDASDSVTDSEADMAVDVAPGT
ncbi:MAG: amino acid permease [Fibrobacterota bacterium]